MYFLKRIYLTRSHYYNQRVSFRRLGLMLTFNLLPRCFIYAILYSTQRQYDIQNIFETPVNKINYLYTCVCEGVRECVRSCVRVGGRVCLLFGCFYFKTKFDHLTLNFQTLFKTDSRHNSRKNTKKNAWVNLLCFALNYKL